MEAISCEALPLPATPKGITTYIGNELAFIYVKRAKANKVSYRTLGLPEYEITNASNFMRGFTPASNPKRGNEMGVYLC